MPQLTLSLLLLLLGGLSLTQCIYLSSRIQCEYRDKNGDSLILNCTLVTGQQSNSQQQSQSASSNESPSSSILINNIDLSASSSSSSSVAASSTLHIKVGIDRSWRTPWESLTINHNIIRTLIWSNSRLAELGEFAFKDLNFLQKLDLSANKLQHIQMSVFRSFEFDLVDLDLSQNMFQFVPEKIFLNKRLESLEILRMNENPIQLITTGSFENLRNLKLLELNYCQIKSIEVNSFDNLKQLESLSLIGNHLRYLSEATFRPFNLRSLYVHDNPLVCDCNLRWLLEYIKNVDYQQQIYESQITLSIPSLSSTSPHLSRSNAKDSSNNNNNAKFPGVAQAAQDYLKCDQPNSLKSKPSFLDINPDSFMCDIRLEFHESVNESFYELGDDALLVCNVYGDPEPDVYWSFGQKPIEKGLSNEENKYFLNEAYSIRKTNKTSELRIRNLELSDFGFYFCTAEIRGSNNRKIIKFNLRRLNQIIGSKSAMNSINNLIDLVLTGGEEFLMSLSNSLLNNKQISNTTLLVLFSIFISLFLFLAFLCLFACWKFDGCCCCCFCFRASKSQHKKKKMLLDMGDLKEEKHLLANDNANGGSTKRLRPMDEADNHNGQSGYGHQNNYTNLANISSATLVSSGVHNNHQSASNCLNNHNKLSNSIRMAYPNINNNNNDIYANHSLLTTTSSTTASYLPSVSQQQQQQQIAIDTSNQTPRYHLLPHPQRPPPHEVYYDDVKYHMGNPDDPGVYSSPYRMQSSNYSPAMRRDDPTVPLYATLKPKLHLQQQQQQQHQNQGQRSNYSHYTTMGRSGNGNTPPLPLPRRYNHQSQNYLLNLPPPPPPPPTQQIPPLKPKRTFEYNNRGDLYSDSGALLLGNGSETTTTTSTTMGDFDPQQLIMIQPNDYIVHNHKIEQLKNQYRMQGSGGVVNNVNVNGSTTSLEEDLDLNDLKDFEDVTFDNLRKPGEMQQQSSKRGHHQNEYGNKKAKAKTSLMSKLNCNNADNKNSEQSLLLKSSSGSEKSNSDNTINRIHLHGGSGEDKLLTSESTAQSSPSGGDELTSGGKVYEETEI